ncbi:hypothetical protein F4604DRAFT_1695416 [Suillus subluteus]|nr:hypothetical protein F4604DRAFT_1695416 [Suillus subluteus]
MELVSQFTEDAVAQEDCNCDRPTCHRRIAKNNPCHYVANIIPGQPGHFGMQMQRPPGMSHLLPDPQIIRQSVNDAQRKSTINPPPVVAFSQPSGSGISCTRTPGPDLLVPSSWQHSQSLGQHNRVAGTAGYSVSHTQYTSEHEWWGKLSYAPPPAETITLEISAVYEGNSQKKSGRGINIGNICEGKKDIDARIDAPGLINLAFDTVIPKLFIFGNGFPWRINEFTVWDAAWVDLSTHQPNIPYFFSQCLVPSRRGQKAPTFKSKQFTLAVIVPAAQWVEYEEWLDNIEESVAQFGGADDGNSVDFGGADDGNGIDFGGADDGNGIDFGGADDGNGIEDSEDGNNIEDSEDGNGIEDFEPEGANSNTRAPSLSAKRTHVRAESDSSTVSPPRKKAGPLMRKGSDELRLPGRDYLRLALKYGGSTNLDVSSKVFDRHHEDVQYYPIPTRSLPDILKTPQYRSFELNISDSSIGQLTIDVPLRSMIGIGAFKTAHPGAPIQAVAATATASLKITCYSSADELKNVLKESKVMYWAKSLLDYTYNYIDHHISTSSIPPPFDIPRVRFIDAGVALGYGQHTATTSTGSKPGAKPGGTVSAVYLLEEHITFGDNEEFTKFIHNMDCVPSLDADEYGYDLAVFLTFTQHIQYVQTEGLAFISDYQGSLTLLTDPQILTHPSVSEGGDVFGDGNIEAMVNEFERKHACNHYCKWPGFGLQPFVSLEKDN